MRERTGGHGATGGEGLGCASCDKPHSVTAITYDNMRCRARGGNAEVRLRRQCVFAAAGVAVGFRVAAADSCGCQLYGRYTRVVRRFRAADVDGGAFSFGQHQIGRASCRERVFAVV